MILEEGCQLLANNPKIGRACDNIRAGLRGREYGRHVVFYRQEAGGILVSRILHQRDDWDCPFLFVPEGRHGVDSCCAAGRHPGG